jgi:hypothetical protein
MWTRNGHFNGCRHNALLKTESDPSYPIPNQRVRRIGHDRPNSNQLSPTGQAEFEMIGQNWDWSDFGSACNFAIWKTAPFFSGVILIRRRKIRPVFPIPPKGRYAKCRYGVSTVREFTKKRKGQISYHGDSGRSEVMLKPYYSHLFRTSIRGRGITSVTGMGCEFRRTTSQKTEAERHGPHPIGFAKPHPSEGRASERHLLGVNHGVRQLSGQRAGTRSGEEAYVPVVNHNADAIEANAVKMPSVAMSA